MAQTQSEAKTATSLDVPVSMFDGQRDDYEIPSTNQPSMNPHSSAVTGFVVGGPDPALPFGNDPADARFIVGNICLLCKRRLKDEHHMRQHVLHSKLHLDNVSIQRDMRVQRARDRRRVSAAQKASESARRAQREQERRAVVEEATTERGTDLNERNKGAQLLAKLGYVKGGAIGASQALAREFEEEERLPSRMGLGHN